MTGMMLKPVTPIKPGNAIIYFMFDFWGNREFSEGLVCVSVHGKSGFIETGGRYIIKPQFDRAGKTLIEGRNLLLSKYREGLINCPDNNVWGFINREDEMMIHPVYKMTKPLYEPIAAVVSYKDLKGNPNRKDKYLFIYMLHS